ncbi:ScyD/ScyE family protein [Arthrobacter antioxidans]|uniref:ScyD/ScyE family protein n=1 Tax=Arthrobacter antioxidans TaxID=2895818 RepID=UPI001FFFA5D3|nr:ScyD/ScyE family protein [Arthrobacter antioxidans]
MQGRSMPIVAAALAVALLSTAGAATASPTVTISAHRGGAVTAGDTTELATGLVSPLRVGIGRDNTAYVSQNFAGRLTGVDRNKTATTLLTRPGIEIGGVSIDKGRVYFTESSGGPGSPDPFVANVGVLEDGEQRELADFAALETENNYDADSEYGFQELPEECAAQLPKDLLPFLLPHGGEVYSHPYATAASHSGRYVYVADAGANVIWTVDTRRETVDATVLEPVPTPVTPELLVYLKDQQQIDLPGCVVGLTYNSQPVPTDIEFGPDGLLYLTSLPGAPEDPTLGSVRSFDPRSGDVELVVSGLTSPTGLAFDRRGNLFVAELFADRISVIAAGTEEAVPFREVARPADVEVDGRYLYATTNAIAGNPGPEALPTEPQGTLERTRLDYGRR